MQQATSEALSQVPSMDVKNVSDLICSYGDNSWVFVEKNYVDFLFTLYREEPDEDEDDDHHHEDEETGDILRENYIYHEGVFYKVGPPSVLALSEIKGSTSKLLIEHRYDSQTPKRFLVHTVQQSFHDGETASRFMRMFCEDVETLYHRDGSVKVHVNIEKYFENDISILFNKNDQFCLHYGNLITKSVDKFLALVDSLKKYAQ